MNPELRHSQAITFDNYNTNLHLDWTATVDENNEWHSNELEISVYTRVNGMHSSSFRIYGVSSKDLHDLAMKIELLAVEVEKTEDAVNRLQSV